MVPVIVHVIVPPELICAPLNRRTVLSTPNENPSTPWLVQDQVTEKFSNTVHVLSVIHRPVIAEGP